MRGILLAADLLFSTRVLGAAQAIGANVEVCPTPAKLLERVVGDDVRLILLDLTTPQFDVAAVVPMLRTGAPSCRIVAFGAHVDLERLRAAADAGCDEVLTRSQFQQSYVKLLSESLSASGEGGQA